jgi:RNA polymerase sigma-70 factor, ECF subfamily
VGDGSASGWEWVYEQARRAWPGVNLGLDRFSAHVARLGLASPGDCPYSGDLFLACACLEGDEAALRELEEKILTPMRPIVGRMHANTDFINEVLQDLQTKLLVGERRGLAGYAGRGPLLAWVRVAASRMAIDLLRAHGEAPPVQDVADAVEEHDLGPEVRMVMEANRELFQEALSNAFASLSVQDRNLLRRHLVDGMTLQEMATPYRVHPATIARRLASLRDSIADTVRSRVAARYGKMSDSQVASLLHAIRSQVYVSLSPLLGTVHTRGASTVNERRPSSQGH